MKKIAIAFLHFSLWFGLQYLDLDLKHVSVSVSVGTGAVCKAGTLTQVPIESTLQLWCVSSSEKKRKKNFSVLERKHNNNAATIQ